MAYRALRPIIITAVVLYALAHLLWMVPYERLAADALCYFLASQALALGRSPFVETGYLYPPFLAVILIPLLRLGIQSALFSWLALTVWSSVTLLLLLRRLVGWRVAAVAVLLFPPIWTSAVVGQVNALLGCLVALALLDLEAQRPRAGAWLALGALIKLTPVLALAGLLLQRRVRPALVGAAVGAAGIALTLPLAGWSAWLEGLRVASQALDPSNPVVAAYNISLTGAGEYWLGMSWPLAVVPLVCLGLTFARIPRLPVERAVAASVLVPLLVGRSAWGYHVVMALPALAVLWRSGGRDRWAAVCCWVVIALVSDRFVPALNLAATAAVFLAWGACLWPAAAPVVVAPTAAQVPALSSPDPRLRSV